MSGFWRRVAFGEKEVQHKGNEEPSSAGVFCDWAWWEGDVVMLAYVSLMTYGLRGVKQYDA